MRSSVVIFMLIVLLIGLAGLLAGCPAVAKDGTITLRVSDAGDHEGRNCSFFVDRFSVSGQQWPPWSSPITGGISEGILIDPDTGAARIFPGGELYTADVFMDVDISGGPPITDGIDFTSDLVTFELEGDAVIEFVYPADFRLAL